MSIDGDYSEGGVLELDVEDFIGWLRMLPGQLGKDLVGLVMSTEMKALIEAAFFAGKLNDWVTFNTDKAGKIRMHLAGIKTVFTDKLTVGRNLLIVDGHLGRGGDNPVSPLTGGGPEGPEGGTPVPMAKAA